MCVCVLIVSCSLLSLSSLTHVVHDGCLSRLTVQVHYGINAGWHVPGCWPLRNTVHKEVQAAIILPHHTNSVSSLVHTQ